MGFLEAVAIFAAGIAAGTINTVVGSGTLITFPVLLAFGYPPVIANVSNTVGLVPGSAAGAVGWSRERTGLLVAEVPALVDELEARGGHVPVLRLPFADGDQADGLPPVGFTTSVELPLRDAAAVGLVARLLAAVPTPRTDPTVRSGAGGARAGAVAG